MHISATILAAVVAVSTHVAAKGINCDGSTVMCGSAKPGALQEIKGGVPGTPLTEQDRQRPGGNLRGPGSTVPDDHIYNNGDHISCIKDFCAFPQGISQGITKARARELLQNLIDHGCKTCGSVPINYGENNNPDVGVDGMLTVNYVTNDEEFTL